MNKYTWIVGVCLALVVGYVAAGPHITISSIKSAISDQNSEQLSDNIDFPDLRQNLKDQLNAQMLKSTANELEDNPFAVLAVGLASTFIDNAIDSFVTPAGLASLMQGERPDPTTIKTADNSEPPDEEDLFRDASYSYDSMNKCSVVVQHEDGDKVTFVLKREGLSWKLVNIILPINNS